MWGEAKEEGGNKHYHIKKQLLYTMCHNEAARISILQAPQMNISHVQPADQNIHLARKSEKAKEVAELHNLL